MARSSFPPGVFAVGGVPGSGRVTLAEAIADEVRRDGLEVGVSATDSPEGTGAEISETVRRAVDMSSCHDLVLVVGVERLGLPTIWLRGGPDANPPPEADSVELDTSAGADQIERAARWLRLRVDETWARRPVHGAVLIGGKGRRMGRPKQTIVHRGATLAELVVRALEPRVEEIVLAGSGPVPEGLRGLARLDDPPGRGGPLAGLLAAMQSNAEVAWLVAACDMPDITDDAVCWLLEQRRPGRWAVVPCSARGRLQPLLAVYEPQARRLLEAQAEAGRWGPRHIARDHRVYAPAIPRKLACSWTNINSPDQLEGPTGDD